jgi:hypothetical protein
MFKRKAPILKQDTRENYTVDVNTKMTMAIAKQSGRYSQNELEKIEGRLNEQRMDLKKDSFSLTDLGTGGGLLNEEQEDAFVRLLIDGGELMPYLSFERMTGPTKEINKIKYGTTVLRPSSIDPTSSDSNLDGRAFKEPRKSKPTTSKLTLQTIHVRAVVDIYDEVLEDNIEGARFNNSIVDLTIDKAGKDIELQMLQGDTTLSAGVSQTNDFLRMHDSLLVKATSNVHNAGSLPLDPGLIKRVQKALPTRYHRNFPNYILAVPNANYLDLQASIASRATNMGDAMLRSGGPMLNIWQTTIFPASQMPSGNALYFSPDNVIYGIQRGMRVEFERKAEEEKTVMVISMRYDYEYLDEPGIVKVTSLGEYTT